MQNMQLSEDRVFANLTTSALKITAVSHRTNGRLPWEGFMRKGACLLAAAVLTLVAPSVAQSATLQDIKSRGELVVAVEASYPPFAFIENGQIVGYDADLLKLVLQDLVAQGVKVNAS